jgi:hypothetical protein
MHCSACKCANDGSAKFCSNCGTALSTAGPHRASAQGGSQGQYPHVDGIAAFNEMLGAKTMGRTYGYCAGLLVPVLGLLGGVFANNFALLLPTVIVGVVVASIVHWMCTVREDEYRELPGALDAAGNLRCVHCGGRGLWKRTPYRSNTTIAACSGCKTELFLQ